MAAEDNCETKHQTIFERSAFIFNNEMLSDVKFVVPVSSGESKSTKAMPAHKFVLAISSPVFFAMFYGQMAETKTLLNYLTVITTVCWNCFASFTATK